jgi:hypothetical protein
MKFYWDINTDYDNSNKPTTTNFIDYLKDRFETNFIDTNQEISKLYKLVNHNEYQLNKYFHFLYDYSKNIDSSIIEFVNNEKDADIKIVYVSSQTLILEGIKNKRTIKFGIEYDIPIPYLTGFYNITESDFCNYNNKRTYLLSYIGGSWRGPRNEFGYSKRDITINNFTNFSINNTEKHDLYTELFFCPMLARTHSEEAELGWENGNFSIKAKEVYWNSVFSWQPYGDTPTRRAFYESILLGNIPIISKSSYTIYKNLLIGEENVKGIAVILDDQQFFDVDYVFNHLLSIKNYEIVKRRQNIQKISNRLQWNITSHENALCDIIQKILDD